MDMQMDKRLVIRERKKQKTAEMDVFVQAESAVSGQMQPQPDVLGEPNASNVSNIANAPERAVYASHYYYTELNTARMLHDLNITGFRIGRTDSEKSGSHPERGTDRAG